MIEGEAGQVKRVSEKCAMYRRRHVDGVYINEGDCCWYTDSSIVRCREDTHDDDYNDSGNTRWPS